VVDLLQASYRKKIVREPPQTKISLETGGSSPRANVIDERRNELAGLVTDCLQALIVFH
jgi:hypothetical protein